MKDFDNLPTGVAPIDGVNANVNKYDDPHIALAKLMTHDLEKANARQREANEAQRASQFTKTSFSPDNRGGGIAEAGSVSPADMQSIRLANIMTTTHLANILEPRRRALIAERMKMTQSAKRFRQIAVGVLVIAAWIVASGMKMPFIPYEYVMGEYLVVRALLIGAIVVIVKTSIAIPKAVTEEEKRLTTLAECMIGAIKSSYGGKFKTARNHFSYDYLLGQFEVPKKALSAKFLHELNVRILQKTGAPMPYSVYRFKSEKFWDRAFFIPAGDIFAKTAALADSVPLEDLQGLAKQAG